MKMAGASGSAPASSRGSRRGFPPVSWPRRCPGPHAPSASPTPRPGRRHGGPGAPAAAHGRPAAARRPSSCAAAGAAAHRPRPGARCRGRCRPGPAARWRPAPRPACRSAGAIARGPNHHIPGRPARPARWLRHGVAAPRPAHQPATAGPRLRAVPSPAHKALRPGCPRCTGCAPAAAMRQRPWHRQAVPPKTQAGHRTRAARR